MTDIELSQKVSPTIAETYMSAINFIKILPDYALLLFRTVLEDLCDNVIAKNAGTPVRKLNTLDKTIDLLFNEQVIDENFKDVLHKIRKLGNRGVHRDYKVIKDNEKFIKSIKNHLSEDAIETRQLLVEAFKLHQNMPSIDIAFSEIHEQEYKQTLFDAMISPSGQTKLRAGLLCELLAEDESKKSLYTRQESLFHIQSLYQHALAFYNASFKISADVEQKRRKLDPRNKADIILEDCNLEPLYRYSKILCQKSDGSEQEEVGLKYLKIASDRKHPAATAFYAEYLYKVKKDYGQAFEYLNKPYVQEDPLTHRILCYYYSDEMVNSINHELALGHIQIAIDLGCPDALFDLGKAYHVGSFVKQDDMLAEEFLQKAIKRGNFEAKKYYFFNFKQNRQALAELMSLKMKKIASALQSIHSNNTPKIGRNDLCPCGSDKKYKKCCGKSQ